jgi:hypothetical protein
MWKMTQLCKVGVSMHSMDWVCSGVLVLEGSSSVVDEE